GPPPGVDPTSLCNLLRIPQQNAQQTARAGCRRCCRRDRGCQGPPARGPPRRLWFGRGRPPAPTATFRSPRPEPGGRTPRDAVALPQPPPASSYRSKGFFGTKTCTSVGATREAKRRAYEGSPTTNPKCMGTTRRGPMSLTASAASEGSIV